MAATLWAVDDEAQRVLMRRLYQRLARGESAAAAIRGAKLDVMREGGAPRDWAALVLWGDPLTRPLVASRQIGASARPASSR